jgi:hypothetical protein
MIGWLLSLELHLRLAGLSLITLGVAHAFFDKRFHWREEMSRVSLLNRQIFFVHTFFIALMLVLLGSLSLFGTAALVEKSHLGLLFLGGVTFFWSCRWLCQFFVYNAEIWRGKRFETLGHIAFSGLWTYYVAVYAYALAGQLGWVKVG